MNVTIINRATSETVVRYEIHRADDGSVPPDAEYFDIAWERADSEGLVDSDRRSNYSFQLQRPKTLYESST